MIMVHNLLEIIHTVKRTDYEFYCTFETFQTFLKFRLDSISKEILWGVSLKAISGCYADGFELVFEGYHSHKQQ